MILDKKNSKINGIPLPDNCLSVHKRKIIALPNSVGKGGLITLTLPKRNPDGIKPKI